MNSRLRRQMLASAALLLPPWARALSPDQARPVIRPTDVLRFPQDHGAHPAFRTEWWYITGMLQTVSAPRRTVGFQITFFRTRVDVATQSASQFAARQLVFAHAALSDISQGRLLHDQRIAREGFGLAEAAQGDTRIALRNWTLQREGPAAQSRYTSHIAARDFTLDLRFTQTQPVLLQGEAGYSRKGPHPDKATHYYSHPQLAVQGQIRQQQETTQVQGRAWLDHEWGESFLEADAVGWDWIGMNLLDGGALTAFRLRRADGSTLWSGGSLRRPGEVPRSLKPDEVRFTPGRVWASPATAARYPVSWLVDVAGTRYEVRARMDNQELDSRQSTGGVYWEGLSDLLDAQGRPVGSGYLEMTGYVAAMSL
ncbi:MAG TPA: carotenoid 1,2-hydratase [Aquabacterium sp.]|uniref:lipocalin-like domain-containing protein n=1 Tax=Aquabacterium sp. TaxID=1872578 RepID=UPI002E325380|nr:carotenoid 1,2-hydratase [Aquabacterium sp.]HEX5357172.1 carotenoid 1,2-hydratase [Aquabacterium sp.]